MYLEKNISGSLDHLFFDIYHLSEYDAKCMGELRAVYIAHEAISQQNDSWEDRF